jgi:hypothetical protein
MAHGFRAGRTTTTIAVSDGKSHRLRVLRYQAQHHQQTEFQKIADLETAAA